MYRYAIKREISMIGECAYAIRRASWFCMGIYVTDRCPCSSPSFLIYEVGAVILYFVLLRKGLERSMHIGVLLFVILREFKKREKL